MCVNKARVWPPKPRVTKMVRHMLCAGVRTETHSGLEGAFHAIVMGLVFRGPFEMIGSVTPEE